jgi:hypothetical protein
LRIFVGELVDDPGPEPAFVIEHIMGDAEPVANSLGVIDVLARAAASRTLHRLAMIVELERDSDHLGAAARGERGHDRAVDAAGHGDDDAGIARGAAKREVDAHRRRALYPKFTLSR